MHCFDAAEKQILVCDSWAKRLILYDLNGQYISSKSMDVYESGTMNYISDLVCTDDNNYVLFNQNPAADSVHRLIFLNNELDLLETGMIEGQVPDNVMFGQRGCLQSFTSHSVVYTPGVDTIYELKDKSFSPIAQLVNIGEGNAKRQYSETQR